MPKFVRSTSYTGRKANQQKTGQSRFANLTEAISGSSSQLIISPSTLSSVISSLTGLIIRTGTSPGGPAPGSSVSLSLPVTSVASSTSVTIEALFVGRRQVAPFESTHGTFLSGYVVDAAGTVTPQAFGTEDVFAQTDLIMTPTFQLTSPGANALNFLIIDYSGQGPIDWKVLFRTTILP